MTFHAPPCDVVISLLHQPCYSDLIDGSGRSRIAGPYTPHVEPGAIPPVPGGLITDWASTPGWLDAVAPGIKMSLGRAATCWHDAAYASGGFGTRYTREECDRIMLALMLLDGVDPELSWCAYNAVRAGGRGHWREPKREVKK